MVAAFDVATPIAEPLPVFDEIRIEIATVQDTMHEAEVWLDAATILAREAQHACWPEPVQTTAK